MPRSWGRNLLGALKKHQGAKYGGDEQMRQRRRWSQESQQGQTMQGPAEQCWPIETSQSCGLLYIPVVVLEKQKKKKKKGEINFNITQYIWNIIFSIYVLITDETFYAFLYCKDGVSRAGGSIINRDRQTDSLDERKHLVVKSLSHVRLFVIPWTAARQTLLSMGFSRQGYWSGLPFPSGWTKLN